MNQDNNNTPQRYSRGEHLKADDVNWLINRASDKTESKRVFSSDSASYILEDIDDSSAPFSRETPKPFDIECEVEEGVLTSVTLKNCVFYDGVVEVDLGDVELETIEGVESIYLCKDDSDSESESASSEASYSIVTEDEGGDCYRLYDIDSEDGKFGIIADYRDGFIHIGGEGGGTQDVELTPELDDGVLIATWEKDGQETEIYSPDYDLTPYLTEGTKIATWTDENGNQTDIYAPNGGGEGGEETTLKGNTSDSAKIGPGDLNFKSGTYSNVEVKTDGTDITISVFYL